MAEEQVPVFEEINSPAMESFINNQKSFKEGFVRYNGYIMPRSYLKEW
jgi:hypothetical protein